MAIALFNVIPLSWLLATMGGAQCGLEFRSR
jgi:hypothetical protein